MLTLLLGNHRQPDGASVLVGLIAAPTRKPNNERDKADDCASNQHPPAAAVGVVQPSCRCGKGRQQECQIDEAGYDSRMVNNQRTPAEKDGKQVEPPILRPRGSAAEIDIFPHADSY